MCCDKSTILSKNPKLYVQFNVHMSLTLLGSKTNIGQPFFHFKLKQIYQKGDWVI